MMDVLVTESHGSDLLVHLYQLYQTSALCDVIIQCRDGVEFNVHRIVLSASSRFLHQMFAANPSLLCVKLDMVSSVVQPLLEYSYTGQLFLSHQLQHGITEAATFLQMYTVLDLIKTQTDRWTDSQTSVTRDTSYHGSYTDCTRNKRQSLTEDCSNTEKVEDDGEDDGQRMVIDLGEVVPERDHRNRGNRRNDTCDNTEDVSRTDLSDVSGKHSRKYEAENVSNKMETFSPGQSSIFQGQSSRSPGRSCVVISKDMSHSPKRTSLSPHVKKQTHHDITKTRKSMKSMKFTQKNNSRLGDTMKGHEMTEGISRSPYTLRRNRCERKKVEEDNDEKVNGEVSRSGKKDFTGIGRGSKSGKGDSTGIRRLKSKQKIYIPERGNVICELCRETFQSFHKLYIHKYRIHSHLSTAEIVSSYLLQRYRKRRCFDNCTRSRSKNSLFSYKCNVCGKHFFRYCLFTLHYREYHKDVELGHSNAGLMQYCMFRSKHKQKILTKYDHNVKSFTNLKNKKIMQFAVISKFDCEICGRMFASCSSLSAHKRQVHGTAEAELDDVKAKPGITGAELFSGEAESGTVKVELAGRKTRQSARKTRSRALQNETEHDEAESGGKRGGLSTKRAETAGRKAGSKVRKADLGAKRGGPFSCPVCRRSMMSQSTVFKHLQTVHQYSVDEARQRQFDLPDRVTCEVSACQFLSRNINTMSEHVKTLHPFIQYPCPHCDAVFQVELLLKRHLETKHSQSKTRRIFTCGHCDRKFPKLHNVQRHEYWKHGILHENIKVHNCEHDGCTYRTLSVTSLRSHQSKHSSEKLFKCEFCDLHLKTEICRRKHVNKMHLGIRPYLCQVCGQSFGEEHELKAHISYKHSTERQFQCSYCVYSSAVKSTFHTHMYNVHKVRAEDDKRVEYQCPHCPFTSLLHHRYQIHVNGHTNTRQYRCILCDKSFVSSSTLKAHKQWLHSDKIHTCTQCEYQTKTLQKLNEHIRVQHQLKGFKPYKCPYCDFTCATGGNTRKHVKQVHKGQEVTYIRNDDMLAAARIARASGHHAPLENLVPVARAKTEICVKLEAATALTVVE